MPLLLLALVAAFFWRLWAPNPADRVAFPAGDFTEQYFPLRRFVAATLAEGRLPFWNPYIFGGQPGLADPQAAALYPPAVLNALLWGADFPLAALQGEVVAHVALAAVGAYAFARGALRLDALSALVAGVVFGFGGYVTGFPLLQVTIVETVAWLPWLLLALRRAAPGEGVTLARRLGWSGAAAGALGLALLAGHPQSALYLGYTSAAYAAFLWLRARPTRATWLADALPLALPFALGGALAAAQLLPTAAFIAESSRQAPSYDFVRGGLAWEELTTLFLPQIIGNNPLYAGIVALLLAPLGLASAGQRGEKRFWAGAALASLGLALGGNSALFDWLYLGLPGVAQVRSQERVLVVWAWAAALGAAWGMAALRHAAGDEAARARLSHYARQLASLLPVVALFWLGFWWLRAITFAQVAINLTVFDAFFARYSFFVVAFGLGWALLAAWGRARGGPAAQRALAALLVALLVWELFSINRGPHRGGPAAQALSPPNEVVAALADLQRAEAARVAVVGNPVPRGNDGMRWGLPLLSGNEPLRLATTEQVLAQTPAWRHVQLFAAGYAVADSDLAAQDPAAWELVARTAADPASYALRVRPPMPYGWLVSDVEIAANSGTLARLQAADFDPRAVALLEQGDPSSNPAAQAGRVAILRRAPGLAEMRAANPSDAPALLVVAEPLARGWAGWVDGQPATLLRANGLNVALWLPPGEHDVTLRYEPPGWRLGLLVSGGSGATILALALGGLSGQRPARRRASQRAA